MGLRPCGDAVLLIPRLCWSGVSAVGSGTRSDGPCPAVSRRASGTPWRQNGLVHCPILNVEGREGQRAIRPAKEMSLSLNHRSLHSQEHRRQAGSPRQCESEYLAWFVGVIWVCTALAERGVRIGDELGAPLRERHQSLVHGEKLSPKVPLALPKAAPGMPG